MKINRRNFVLGSSLTVLSGVSHSGFGMAFSNRSYLSEHFIQSVLRKKFPSLNLHQIGVQDFIFDLRKRPPTLPGASLSSLNESMDSKHELVDLERFVCREFVLTSNVLECLGSKGKRLVYRGMNNFLEA